MPILREANKNFFTPTLGSLGRKHLQRCANPGDPSLESTRNGETPYRFNDARIWSLILAKNNCLDAYFHRTEPKEHALVKRNHRVGSWKRRLRGFQCGALRIGGKCTILISRPTP
jgi:hypothetical protein